MGCYLRDTYYGVLSRTIFYLLQDGCRGHGSRLEAVASLNAWATLQGSAQHAVDWEALAQRWAATQELLGERPGLTRLGPLLRPLSTRVSSPLGPTLAVCWLTSIALPWLGERRLSFDRVFQRLLFQGSAKADRKIHSFLAARLPVRTHPLNPTCPSKVPKRMAKYPKIESIGSTGSIILGILEVQVQPKSNLPCRAEFSGVSTSTVEGFPADGRRFLCFLGLCDALGVGSCGLSGCMHIAMVKTPYKGINYVGRM